MRHVATTRGGGWRAVLVVSLLAAPTAAFGQPAHGPTGPDVSNLTLDHGVIRSPPVLHASRRMPDHPRELLREAMEAQGFTVYPAEWWHFDYEAWRRYRIGNQTFEEVG